MCLNVSAAYDFTQLSLHTLQNRFANVGNVTVNAMKSIVVFCFLAKYSANVPHFQILSTL